MFKNTNKMEKLKVLIRWFGMTLGGIMSIVLFAAIMIGIGKVLTYIIDARSIEVAILLCLSVISIMIGALFMKQR